MEKIDTISLVLKANGYFNDFYDTLPIISASLSYDEFSECCRKISNAGDILQRNCLFAKLKADDYLQAYCDLAKRIRGLNLQSNVEEKLVSSSRLKETIECVKLFDNDESYFNYLEYIINSISILCQNVEGLLSKCKLFADLNHCIVFNYSMAAYDFKECQKYLNEAGKHFSNLFNNLSAEKKEEYGNFVNYWKANGYYHGVGFFPSEMTTVKSRIVLSREAIDEM